jgi:hypothetical protein
MASRAAHRAHRRAVWRRLAAVVAAAALLALVGCGGDDDDTASDAAGDGTTTAADGSTTSGGDDGCDALQGVYDAFGELQDVDLANQGLDGLRAALGTLADEVEALVDDTRSDFSDEVDALSTSVGDLVDTVASIGDGTPVSEVTPEIREGVDEVGTSVSALQDAAADAC